MAKEHIKVFIDIDGVEVSGIFSRTFENASNLAKQFGINYIASSVYDLYENTKADIVVNSVSVLSIFETSLLNINPLKLILTRGKDTATEKSGRFADSYSVTKNSFISAKALTTPFKTKYKSTDK